MHSLNDTEVSLRCISRKLAAIFNGNIYVRRKVRIGIIPELSCAKWEFSLRILKLRNYLTIKTIEILGPEDYKLSLFDYTYIVHIITEIKCIQE